MCFIGRIDIAGHNMGPFFVPLLGVYGRGGANTHRQGQNGRVRKIWGIVGGVGRVSVCIFWHTPT